MSETENDLMLDEKKFNLADDPWILTTDSSGNETVVSVSEAITRAHELKTLSGGFAAQDAAVLRLLLAVLYAIFTRSDETGSPLDDDADMVVLWRKLWIMKRFPEDLIVKYLSFYRERFWLVHPEVPFWQVVFDKNNPPVNGDGVKRGPTTNEVVKLIGDIANQDNLFCGRTETAILTFPEAARWLVHLNAYDISPGGNPGKEVKAIKGYGHPWPAGIGITWVGGDNLFETLMLNLVLMNNDANWDESAAWWETEPPCRTVDDLESTVSSLPDGIVELMSKQYRYVKLLTDGDYVTGYETWSGVQFDGYVFMEQMTPWRKKKDGKIYPFRYNATRQIWRDFSALMQHEEDLQPGVLKWISKVKDVDISVPLLQIHTVGITYKKDTAVADIFSDNLSVNADMLSVLGLRWIDRIGGLLELTDKLVWVLGGLAEEIAEASGAGDKASEKREEAKTTAYFNLDKPFRQWLAGIVPSDDDIETPCAEWVKTARTIVRRLGKAMHAEAGDKAFIGIKKQNQTNKLNQVITASTAYIKFTNLIAHYIKESMQETVFGKEEVSES